MHPFTHLSALAALLSLFALPTRAQTIITSTVDIGNGGDTGQWASHAIVAGNPAIAYYNESDTRLMFARNSDASGNGTWTITAVDSDGSVGRGASLAVIGGNPAISYCDNTNGHLKFARNSAPDGSGTWIIIPVDGPDVHADATSMVALAGNPGIAYHVAITNDLRLARSGTTDGSGPWTITTVDSVGEVGLYPSLAVLVASGTPAISYNDYTNGNLKFARNSAADGSGTWTFTTVDTGGTANVGYTSSLACLFNTNPAISYYDITNGDLKFARCSSADGSGTWTVVTVDAPGVVGFNSSLRIVGTIPNRGPAISYYDFTNGNLKFARNSATDGAGSWTLTAVDTLDDVGDFCSMALVNGTPGIAYYDKTAGNLRFIRNGAADGTGTWVGGLVDSGFKSGVVGTDTSQAIVAGNPAIAYVDSSAVDLKFARSSTADGSGNWTVTTIDTVSSQYVSLAIVNGHPAVCYDNRGAPELKFARNSAADGSGTWTVTTVNNQGGDFTSLAVINGVPAISYRDARSGFRYLWIARGSDPNGTGVWNDEVVQELYSAGIGNTSLLALSDGRPTISFVDASTSDGAVTLTFARNSAADGSGVWVKTIVDGSATVEAGGFCSAAIVAGHPAASYYNYTNGDLKFARNNAADGTGTWTIAVVDSSATYVGQYTSLKTVLGYPAISYYDLTNRQLKYARNSAADGSGAWTLITVDAGPDVGTYTSMAILANRNVGISYFDVPESALKWATLVYPAEIVVEQPPGLEILDGGARTPTASLGFPTSQTFTIKNLGNPDLTGLGITKDGPDAADFVVTSNPIAPVPGPSASTTFTVQFAPTTPGTKTAALHIGSNDPDENPFDIQLTGAALSFTQDTDGDGLNDGSEYRLEALGFDWQVNQSGELGLVNTLFSNLNGVVPNLNNAGFYTTAQIQVLNVGVPLIERNAITGSFTLTIALKRTTDLTLPFTDFPLDTPGTSAVINAGKLEFEFAVPDNAAFFRLESQ